MGKTFLPEIRTNLSASLSFLQFFIIMFCLVEFKWLWHSFSYLGIFFKEISSKGILIILKYVLNIDFNLKNHYNIWLFMVQFLGSYFSCKLLLIIKRELWFWIILCLLNVACILSWLSVGCFTKLYKIGLHFFLFSSTGGYTACIIQLVVAS